MSTTSDFEKRRLHMKAISRNLTELSEEEQKKLVDGLQNVPQKQMLDQAQYLENILLPKIAINRGVESEDYKFYKSVSDSLLWAIFIVDRFEFLKTEYATEQLMREFLQEKLIIYKNELNKYQTAEEMIMSHTYDRYAQAVGVKVKDKINGK
jgi:hypothetical protein